MVSVSYLLTIENIAELHSQTQAARIRLLLEILKMCVEIRSQDSRIGVNLF
jgi:hypothetical protein